MCITRTLDIGSSEGQSRSVRVGRDGTLTGCEASGCVHQMQRSALYLARLRACTAARDATVVNAADERVELQDGRQGHAHWRCPG